MPCLLYNIHCYLHHVVCIIINSYFANYKKKFNIMNSYNETPKKIKEYCSTKVKLLLFIE